MNRFVSIGLSLALVPVLASCTAAVSDLNGFSNYGDACDPRGAQHLGDDLHLQFFNMTPHVNQQIFATLQVGDQRNVEAIFVIDRLTDLSNPVEGARGTSSANLLLDIPEIMPADPTTLAFWANSVDPDIVRFDSLMDTSPDHQWTRPVCPDGDVTFTHTTPFQSVLGAVAVGAVWHFMVPGPTEIDDAVFDNFTMAAWAVRVNALGRQTRAYYRWSPYVALAPGMPVPPQRDRPAQFQVGRNALGEERGAIDQGELYEVHFVIDVDHDGELGSAGDYVCVWEDQQMPNSDPVNWVYAPDLSVCDAPAGFDPATFSP